MSQITAASPVPTHIDEPLERLSRFTFDWAGDLCDPAHGCMGYHRMWSLVRHVETAGKLPQGRDFFHRELRAMARPEGVRVMLSGAADTGLPSLAAGAFAGTATPLTIVIADRCRTPLEQTRLYAASVGLHIETYHGTLDTVFPDPVDAVLSHSFLAFIPAPDRPALFAAWARSLRSGGRVLLSQRLIPDGESYARKRPAVEVAARREALAVRLAEHNPAGASTEAVLDAAEALWLNSMGGNPTTESDLHSLAEGAGMDVIDIRYDDSKESVSPFMLKAQATDRRRAEVVIVKR